MTPDYTPAYEGAVETLVIILLVGIVALQAYAYAFPEHRLARALRRQHGPQWLPSRSPRANCFAAATWYSAATLVSLLVAVPLSYPYLAGQVPDSPVSARTWVIGITLIASWFLALRFGWQAAAWTLRALFNPSRPENPSPL